MIRFVLDSLVALGWCFEDEQNEYSESVLDVLTSAEALVPCLWVSEWPMFSGQRYERIGSIT